MTPRKVTHAELFTMLEPPPGGLAALRRRVAAERMRGSPTHRFKRGLCLAGVMASIAFLAFAWSFDLAAQRDAKLALQNWGFIDDVAFLKTRDDSALKNAPTLSLKGATNVSALALSDNSAKVAMFWIEN